jgi:Protein of unknown function (DUF2868)
MTGRRPSSSTSLFRQALDIPAWLETDRDTPYELRLRRDRRIGMALSQSGALPRVRGWWMLLRTSDDHRDVTDEHATRIEHARRVISVLMVLIGMVAGAATALGVFHYDGTWPVNVVTAFAALVLIQVLLIALTIILMLPHVPGLRALQSFIAGFNPGALMSALYRRSRRLDDMRATLLDWQQAHGPAAGRFSRWQMLVWSQTAAFTFNLTVLVTASALITFTDLAFGWSTTLRVNAAQVSEITNAICLPWHNLWPAAVPGAELIESSRFFRLSSAPPAALSAAELTGWWPFLLASLVTYALLPRTLMLVIASIRLRHASEQLLLDNSLVRALLDRLDSPDVKLSPDDREPPPDVGGATASAPPLAAPHPTPAFVWCDAIAHDAIGRWSEQRVHRSISEVFTVGAGTAEADATALEQIAKGAPSSVLIFVRAWEAPLLDLKDFLTALRARVGTQCSLIVVPVATDHRSPPTTVQRSTWSRWVGRIADPGIYMECGS